MEKQFKFIILIYNCLALLQFSSCVGKENQGLPELETEDITTITQTTAISGGKFISDGGTGIIVKGVCWSINPNPTVLSPHSSDGSGTENFVSTLTDLSTGTEYHVRAYAENNEGTSYGDDKTFRTRSSSSTDQIIADHTVVDKFDDIPLYYMNEVKKMWFVPAGESHSLGCVNGLVDLESLYPAYDVGYSYQGTPESYTNSHLRIGRATWGDANHATGWIWGDYGEEDWFETTASVTQTKAGIKYCHDHGLEMSAFGFFWCWDPTFIDAAPYLAATQAYIDYCAANGYGTKIYFETGPVDQVNSSGETGYNKYLEYEAIRNYVKSNPTRILFDFADILSYDDNGSGPNTATWNGHTYPIITTTNNNPPDVGHISYAGQLRIAKAVWWMLARMAGWDGEK